MLSKLFLQLHPCVNSTIVNSPRHHINSLGLEIYSTFTELYFFNIPTIPITEKLATVSSRQAKHFPHYIFENLSSTGRVWNILQSKTRVLEPPARVDCGVGGKTAKFLILATFLQDLKTMQRKRVFGSRITQIPTIFQLRRTVEGCVCARVSVSARKRDKLAQNGGMEHSEIKW